MKLNHYVAAIADCEACLQLEPENVKACLRLADANYAQGRRREVSLKVNLSFLRVIKYVFISPITCTKEFFNWIQKMPVPKSRWTN